MTDDILQKRQRWRRALGALLVALGISTGAFGAHAVPDPTAAGWMQTAGLYLMIHGLAAIMLPNARHRIAVKVMYSGACLFAMTLLAMVAGAPRWLGAITPIGGALMIIGWLMVAWTEWRQR